VIDQRTGRRVTGALWGMGLALLSGCAPTKPLAYSTDFSSGPRPEWSSDFVSRTPKTNSPFLGQFCNDTVTLKLQQLPRHDFVHLSFKLYIINTWDGIAQQNGSSRIGPDFWSLDVGDGRNLIRSTFSNTNNDPGFSSAAKYQNFPAVIASQPVLYGMGADSQNELGYIYTFKGYNVSFPMDSVYTIDVTIPHSANHIEFDFSGAELQGLSDEGWGIADVHVETLAAADVPKIPADQFEHLFNDAAGGDTMAADRAFWKLVSNGDATTEYIAKNVKTLGVNTLHVMKASSSLALADPAARRFGAALLYGYGPVSEEFLSSTNIGRLDPKSLERKIAEEIVVRPIESSVRRRGAVAARLLTVIKTPRSAAVFKSLFEASQDEPAQPEDWAEAFAANYFLEKGQVVKYIAPPLIPERGDYWPRQQRYANRLAGDIDADIRPMPSQMLLRVFDESVDLTTVVTPIYWKQNAAGQLGPAEGLTAILQMLGVRPTSTLKVMVPPEMETGFALPGDWLVRFRAKPAAILAALPAIIKEQTGVSIRFEPTDKPGELKAVFDGATTMPAVER